MKKKLLSLVIALFSTGLFAQSIPFDNYGSVLLESYSELSDDAIIKVVLTVTNEESRVGWGVGKIFPIGNYSADFAYEFICKASSATGEANEYEFTVAQFKEFAKIDGEYWIDTSDGNNRSGITINAYNGAVLTSITVGEAVAPSATINFEADQIGDTYPGIAWNDSNFTAIVEASPTEGQSLHFVSTNWNSYPKFAVSLPDQLKLGDIEKITFNLYFTDSGSSDQNSWKNFHLFVGETGASFVANEPTQAFDNLVGSDARNVWIAKEIVLNIADETLSGLSTFDLGLGELVENADYYLDDISFVPKAVAPIPDTFNVIFDVQGGSEVEAQRVVEGDTAVKPADPTKADYVFTGWYTAATGGNEYLFNSPVTTNLTLYAQWVNNSAIENLINASNIRVYPSPTKGIVNIENNKGEVLVYSVTGRLIMRTLGNKVDLSAQPDGSYILKVGNNTVKVIKKQ